MTNHSAIARFLPLFASFLCSGLTVHGLPLVTPGVSVASEPIAPLGDMLTPFLLFLESCSQAERAPKAEGRRAVLDCALRSISDMLTHGEMVGSASPTMWAGKYGE